MIFQNREEAARLLLKKLSSYRDKNSLVLGIPRGAMPMAKIIAEGLHGELSAILVHKIPAPAQEELAIGSVGLSGNIFRNSRVIDYLSVRNSYIEAAAQEQLKILKKRQEKFQIGSVNYQDRIVIIVDDGIATGATVFGAVHEVKTHKPKKLIVAAAAISHDTAEALRPLIDELVVLEDSDSFYAVSQFFVDFTQVSDEEVVEILRSRSQPRPEMNV